MQQVDLESRGKRVVTLPVSISTHESAYGQVSLQLGVISSGAGPRVLLVGGNHGDEYEGQIALRSLWHRLEPSDVTGTILVLPAANPPAVDAGRRTSPLDEGNLNRSFPGKDARGPTEMIAAQIHALLPKCDFVLDLHSGGSSLIYLPCLIFGRAADPAVLVRQSELARAFGGPNILSFASIPGADNSLSGSATAMGIPALATELGGGGLVNLDALALASNGIMNLLNHIGAVRNAAVPAPSGPTRELVVPDGAHFVRSPGDGIFEPLVDIEAHVRAGQVAGFLHEVHDPFRRPLDVRFSADGIVVCKTGRARAKPGDCLFHTAVETML